MWIAKPVGRLTKDEIAVWSHLEVLLPLSQTLSWAHAIEAVSGRAFLVFSPDEGVGGIVFDAGSKEGRIRFECVNGPHLSWDDPSRAPRQFATFCMAVAQLDKQFSSLSIKPRWARNEIQQRLRILPLEAFRKSNASTVIIPIQSSLETQFLSLSSRMRRTLQLGKKNQVVSTAEKLTPDLLKNFVLQLASFGATKGFTVPTYAWFEAFTSLSAAPRVGTSQLSFWLISSRKFGEANSGKLQSLSQILVCRHANRAHYLFGYEVRSNDLRSAISTSAAAQWEALSQCALLGVESYDLNGYMVNATPEHPYFGVTRFKDQFAGRVLEYEIPEFVIE